MKSILCLLAIAALVAGDCYLHNPRGSNNRVDQNANAPGNRMFDSQNNNEAGYNLGNGDTFLGFYEGSILSVGWTSQHACGDTHMTNCMMVLQYRCDALMRDGVNTNQPTAPLASSNAEPPAGDGRHEPYMNLLSCQTRQRNLGLFTADQNVGNNALSTRQNPGGGRSGYECAEERDYYPYWHPGYWTDIAIMTNNLTMCPYYQAQSENVLGRGYCSTMSQNNPAACAQVGGTWTQAPSFGVAAPECVNAPYSRANLHGNAIQPDTIFEQSHYNWTMPTLSSAQKAANAGSACILRVRYNITTGDYDGWNTFASANALASPVTNNPLVDLGVGTPLQLNINTAQFGRTFEDRSHIFQLLSRPSYIGKNTQIWNVNVRGKRGNNAATYPSTEYDFVPSRIHIPRGAYVHWQWTGSNNNPNGNDRNNFVQFGDVGKSYPYLANQITMFNGAQNAAAKTSLLMNSAFSCGSVDPNLQDVQPFCNVGIVKFPTAGTYHYLGIKNHAFSNRDQKGDVIVGNGALSTGAIIGIVAGAVGVLGAGAGAAVYMKRQEGSSGSMPGRF